MIQNYSLFSRKILLYYLIIIMKQVKQISVHFLLIGNMQIKPKWLFYPIITDVNDFFFLSRYK